MFTSLDDADVAAIAAAFGLGTVDHWRPIAAGTINSNFEIATEQGRYFVRVNEGKERGDVAWEAELAAHLAESGVPTPVPLRTHRGPRLLEHRGLLISAFPWLRGHHPAADEVSVETAGEIGAALARVHLAGVDFPGERRAGIYTWPHIVERFEAFRTSDDPGLADAIAVLGAAFEAIDAHAAERAALPRSVVHGDLFRDNVLFDDHHLVALLDFEQASDGAPVYDLAVALNDWCWDGGPRRDLAVAMLAGYQRVRPLDEAERALLPVEIRAAAVRFTVTRITDVYLPGIANKDKDFRDFLARVKAWQGGGVAALLE